MAEKLIANVEKLGFARHPPDLVQELAAWIDPLPKEVHTFLHPLYLGDLGISDEHIAS